VSVKATVRRLDAYSGHADRTELIDWVKERLPAKRAIFLTHGEESALASLKDGLVATGCAAERVLIPRLDDRIQLTDGEEAPRPKPAEHRLPPEAVGRPDWHNDYAALALDLQHRLNELADDAARRRLLRQVRALLEKRG
jgi:metallo-beta-lactamase family protein